MSAAPERDGAVDVTFWGVRGTQPVPGRDAVRYGGHTACVSVSVPGQPLIVFDAGTGMGVLSEALVARGGRVDARVLVTHPHWDHISGLPFFDPLFVSGNAVTLCGPRNGAVGMREVLLGQLDGIRFPRQLDATTARITYDELDEGEHEVGGAPLRALRLRHPGRCLGYRVEVAGRSIAYVTDNELFPSSSPAHDAAFQTRLTAFVAGSDMLVIDATYTDDEYPAVEGRGHSAVGSVTRLAHEAGVAGLYLFHHDPSQRDPDIDRKLAAAVDLLVSLGSSTRCVAPADGDVVVL